MFEVTLITAQRTIFRGPAKSIVLPGESGVFEITPFHVNIISRLVGGYIVIDGRNSFIIKRGVVKLEKNVATIIVEEP